MSEYSVEFRIYGKDLDISQVTADLGLTPSLVKQVGDRKGKDIYWEEAVWGYDGSEEGAKDRYWDSLSEGLTFILEALKPVKDKLEKYKSNYKLILWCGHFQSTFDGGFTLPPHLLKLLGEFGVELFVVNYFSTMVQTLFCDRT
jgi:uncharacterized protein DUF4279